jgi:Ca2+-binding EF-hand superfamily protein
MTNIINNVSKLNASQKLQQACLSYLANYLGYAGIDEERQKLKEIFKVFDQNGDGCLAYEEIFEGYKQYFNGDEKRAEIEAKRIL